MIRVGTGGWKDKLAIDARRQRILAGILLLLFAMGCETTVVPSVPAPSPTPVGPTPRPEWISAQVVEIVDGDTIRVEVQGETYTVRYIGIDAPET